jgi:hypothetical protein
VIWAKERAPTPYLYGVFIFGLEVESIKEFGGASITLQNIFKIQMKQKLK